MGKVETRRVGFAGRHVHAFVHRPLPDRYERAPGGAVGLA
jgi:hypothetical protein